VLKPPRVGAGNIWHEDNARFKVPEVGRGVGIWIALHESTLANGTLEIVPSSHMTSHLDNPSRRPDEEEEGRRVAAEMPAGGVAFFNFGVLHCTRDNQTEAPRAAAVFHFLNGEYPPDEASLAFGRRIPLSGPEASGGQREYGRLVAGTWEVEVARVLAGTP